MLAVSGCAGCGWLCLAVLAVAACGWPCGPEYGRAVSPLRALGSLCGPVTECYLLSVLPRGPTPAPPSSIVSVSGRVSAELSLYPVSVFELNCLCIR